MKKINIFKKVYYSIICKKYKEMIEEKSWTAIGYLAIWELLFTFIISLLVVKNFLTASFIDVYNYINDFLADFFYNSISLTFDTILVISILGYVYGKIRKLKIKYSGMFCLATYSSTLAMILKYIIFILNYLNIVSIDKFKYLYIIIVLIYFLKNYTKEKNDLK